MEQEKTLVMIAIDPEIRDRLKVQAVKIKKTMREIVEELIGKYLEKAGE